MKRAWSIILCLCLVCAVSAAAAQDITGVWKMKSIRQSGFVISAGSPEETATMYIYADGTVSVAQFNEMAEGVWKEDGEGWIMEFEDGGNEQFANTWTLKMDGDALVMTDSTYAMDMIFELDAEATAQLSAPAAEAAGT